MKFFSIPLSTSFVFLCEVISCSFVKNTLCTFVVKNSVPLFTFVV